MAKTPDKSDVDGDLIHRLAKLLDETGLSEIEYGRDGWHVRVAKDRTPAYSGHQPAPAARDTSSAPVTGSAEDAAIADHPGVVTAPMVGVVYTAAEPNAPPFVKEGDVVTKGQVVMLVEAMKMFNSIEAPNDGTVSRILVTSGTPVEYGEPLLIIE